MRLLDLFSGAGGAAMGYHLAGFDHIVGIDLESQPEYPFEFHQGDVFTFDYTTLGEFDVVHASPPCQDYTPMNNRWGGGRYPKLIPQTLELIDSIHRGVWIVENVIGSHHDLPGSFIRIHGAQVGLPIVRERLFASNALLMGPPPMAKTIDPIGVYGKPDGRWLFKRADGTKQYAWSSIEQGQELLGVPWITDPVQIAEAVPPAYTEYIGRQLLDQGTLL